MRTILFSMGCALPVFLVFRFFPPEKKWINVILCAIVLGTVFFIIGTFS